MRILTRLPLTTSLPERNFMVEVTSTMFYYELVKSILTPESLTSVQFYQAFYHDLITAIVVLLMTNQYWTLEFRRSPFHLHGIILLSTQLWLRL